MIKKILLKSLVLVGLILFMLFMIFTNGIKPNMLKAYQISNENLTGNYPVELPSNFNELYYHDNLLDTTSISGNFCGVTFTQDNESVININGTATSYCEVILWQGSISDFTFYTFTDERLSDSSIYMFFSNASTHYYQFNAGHYYSSNNLTRLVIGYGPGQIFNNFKLKLMAVNGNSNFTEYHQHFKFGYQIQANATFKNNTSSNVNGDLFINLCPRYNNSVCNTSIYQYSTNITLPSNQTAVIDTINFYTPFVINENGYITYKYNSIITTTFAQNSLTNVNLTLDYIPIFRATPINNNINNNNLIMKLTYVYNNLILNNLKLTAYQDNAVSGTDLCLLQDRYNTQICLNNNSNNYVSNDYFSEVYTNNIIFDQNMLNYINRFRYTSWDYYSKGVSIISIDSLNIGIKNNVNNTTPNLVGNNDYEIYNSCSAWYDIPCQLGNATTFVIFNIPFIGPVISLLKNIIVIFSSLITMLKWYEGLGIIFSVFILILIIRILIMILKGSNDDRGGKNT